MGPPVSDINERVSRDVMCRTPKELPRGLVSHMDQPRRDIRGKKSHSVAAAFGGEG